MIETKSRTSVQIGVYFKFVDLFHVSQSIILTLALVDYQDFKSSQLNFNQVIIKSNQMLFKEWRIHVLFRYIMTTTDSNI